MMIWKFQKPLEGGDGHVEDGSGQVEVDDASPVTLDAKSPPALEQQKEQQFPIKSDDPKFLIRLRNEILSRILL